jgi:hypothetical protein
VTLVAAIDHLEQARATAQAELDAIDAALSALRKVSSGAGPSKEPGSPSSPPVKGGVHPPIEPSSRPARISKKGPQPRRAVAHTIPAEVKAEVIAYAREHGTEAAVKRFSYAQSSIDRWRREAGERRVSGRKKGEKAADNISPKVTPALPVLPPSTRVEKPEAPQDAARSAAIESAGLDEDDAQLRAHERFRKVTPVAKPKVGAALTPALKLRILDYALTHTVQETATRFAVDQRHIYDWRASRAQIEKEAGAGA